MQTIFYREFNVDENDTQQQRVPHNIFSREEEEKNVWANNSQFN